MLDTATIRPQFPILETSVHGKPLIYLDNAATTQKPLAVLDAIRHYYDTENANVHRGSHYLSQLATEAHEESRETVACPECGRFCHDTAVLIPATAEMWN